MRDAFLAPLARRPGRGRPGSPIPGPGRPGAASAGEQGRPGPDGRRSRRRLLRTVPGAGLLLVACAALQAGTGYLGLVLADSGAVSPAAHGTGHDAEWLGHAWVDGRKGPADVAALAAALRTTGIHDLFVHSGPLRDDGTLDPALLPRARWLTAALHAAAPAVRVQAWLGAHPVPEHLHLDAPATRANLLASVRQVLADGYAGVHLDFEPVDDGNPDLLAVLHAVHAVTRQQHALLSVSAIHTQPVPGPATLLNLLPGRWVVWSDGYLHRVAGEVDQVALMAYDTGLPTRAGYGGYVRRVTAGALAAVPARVTLFIGVPAYHDRRLTHHEAAETVAAALRGIRLALGAHPPRRDFGVAIYVDFAATPADWASYRRDWADAGAASRPAG
jgi:hypothetical protein